MTTPKTLIDEDFSLDYAYPSLWDGCIGAWCASVGTTGVTALDYSGNNNAGTLTSVSWVNSNGLNCWSFSGSTSYIKVPISPVHGKMINTYSESCWFNTTATSGAITSSNGINVTKWQLAIGSAFGVGTSTKLTAQIYSTGGTHVSTVTTTNAVNDGKWHHAVQTISPSTLSLYLDGVLQGSVTTQGGNVTENDCIIFGADGNNNAVYATPLYLNGYIDDIRIYNRVLTTDEISLLYNGGFGRGIAYTPIG